jgi:hypothetical protein
MKYTHTRSALILAVLLAVSCAALIITLAQKPATQEAQAQNQNTNNQRPKTLLEAAQERDVEMELESEGEWQCPLDGLVTHGAEATVLGKITKVKVEFEGDYFLHTIYSVDVQRILEPYSSKLPVGLYRKLTPKPITTSLKIVLSGGSTMVNGHKVVVKSPGQEPFIEGKTYIFFLSWSDEWEAYTLGCGASGAVLVQDDFRIKTLATRDDLKQANAKYDGEDLETFIGRLLKADATQP